MRLFLTAVLVGAGTLVAAAPSHAQSISIGRYGVNINPFGSYYAPYYQSYYYGAPSYPYSYYSYPSYGYYNGWNRGWRYNSYGYGRGNWNGGHYHTGHGHYGHGHHGHGHH